jgi:myosin-crossreactive antigen
MIRERLYRQRLSKCCPAKRAFAADQTEVRGHGRGQMKAHIVGGGFGGLAAAVCLIRNGGIAGQDITIYEARERLGGAFSLAGSAATGYILPTGAIFDAEFRCAFDLLSTIPSADNPAVSVKDDFFAFRWSGKSASLRPPTALRPLASNTNARARRLLSLSRPRTWSW